MSFLSKLRDLFSLGTEEVVFSFPPHSELSNPRCLRLTSQLVQVLRELSHIPHPITANKFNKISSIPSADKRLNELKKLGYVDYTECREGKRYFLYQINTKGLEILGK